jgi:ribosomal protein L21E
MKLSDFLPKSKPDIGDQVRIRIACCEDHGTKNYAGTVVESNDDTFSVEVDIGDGYRVLVPGLEHSQAARITRQEYDHGIEPHMRRRN